MRGMKEVDQVFFFCCGADPIAPQLKGGPADFTLQGDAAQKSGQPVISPVP